MATKCSKKYTNLRPYRALDAWPPTGPDGHSLPTDWDGTHTSDDYKVEPGELVWAGPVLFWDDPSRDRWVVFFFHPDSRELARP